MILLILSLLLAAPFGVASNQPVKSEVNSELFGDTLRVSFNLSIADGWHVYSANLGGTGPTEAEMVIDNISGAEMLGGLQFVGKEEEKFDNLFDMQVRYFSDKVTFIQTFIVEDTYYIEGALQYGACDDESCLPPQKCEFVYNKGAAANAQLSDSGSNVESLLSSPLWKPVDFSKFEDASANAPKGLWGILLAGMLGGLLAIFTPCVWPIIPMTVSMFIKRAGSRKESIRDAIVYGFSIIVIYVGLGLLITLLFGASALNALATHAIPNLIFFVLLVVFALSFFGLFEITLPSSWSTMMSSKSRSGAGLASIFFMAFTLCLVSFSCTGPIIGFLLVEAVSGEGMLMPMMGMLGFAVALALPFSLFAMFPNWLKSAPKSGDWMDKLKVVLGFIELAFALKFFSVADMAYGWGILSRNTFIVLWIILSLLLGLYLLGLLKFKKREEGEERVKPAKLEIALAILCFGFAIYLVPGLKGEPLKAISAFAPPMTTQKNANAEKMLEAQFTNYEEGLAYAKKVGKPVLLDFTGFGCVNCRKMEAVVWVDSRVKQKIEEDFVLVSLYVDDKTPLDRTIVMEEGGKTTKVRTVGDKWSLLERYKFGANAQPFYVILDSEGNLLSGSYTFEPDVDKFLDFLDYN
ncbi:MAG: thioredoxin family protein [Bacteroidaceae bacterium]|nr:thioredoxin family protein [Bacteroidaceae bacterium]